MRDGCVRALRGEPARVLRDERGCSRQRCRARVLRDERGQATVEYLIVALALASVVLGLGALARAVEDGLFVEHATASASHSAGQGAKDMALDVLLY